MVVHTQLTSPVAEKAQRGTMELLLINHPLDCPVCDKGGECPLQNQAMSNGQAESRFHDVKRTYPKPIKISEQVLLDRERCVLCARCTRFSQQIAGDPFIELFERGALQQVAVYTSEHRAVQLLLLRQHHADLPGRRADRCRLPVPGPARSTWSRRRASASTARPAARMRTDWRRGKVTAPARRRRPRGQRGVELRQGPVGLQVRHPAGDRITTPLVRDEAGVLRPASWPEALDIAARGLAAARDGAGVGVLPGGRLTVEDAYAYAKFARVALAPTTSTCGPARTAPRSSRSSSSQRGRPADGGHLRRPRRRARRPARRVRARGGVADRLPPAAQGRPPAALPGLRGRAVHAPRASARLRDRCCGPRPGAEAAVLNACPPAVPPTPRGAAAATALALARRAVILVGERLATSPGALTAAAGLAAAHRCQARLGPAPGR